jgi:hypothetical protein
VPKVPKALPGVVKPPTPVPNGPVVDNMRDVTPR